MSHDDIVSNPSGNRPFADILKEHQTRRDVLAGGIGLATTAFFAPSIVQASNDYNGGAPEGPLMNFTPVPLPQGESRAVPRISEDYQFEVLIPWGDPISPDGPAYSYPPTPENQIQQIGIGHDGMWFFPKQTSDEYYYNARWGFYGGPKDGDEYDANGFRTGNFRVSGSSTEGMLAINHEFGRNTHVYGKSAPENINDVLVSQFAHGVSIVGIKKIDGKWQTYECDAARRIHVNTPVKFSGPAAGTRLLETPAGNAPLGTVNNCSNGYTPWGTYLTCEENFNGYFGATNPENWEPTEAQERYGFTENGFGYGWEDFDPRFDLSLDDFKNEENRFGWVVEIDPNDGRQIPVKRTALGRFKHEGVALGVGAGNRVVCYMGDDQRFDYIYKFVSAADWRYLYYDRGASPLDWGSLYVARFDSDGTGEWMELTIDNPVLKARFKNQAEVLTYARLAADALGATPMDRPEWTTIAPNGDVYCTLTNNSRREVADAANPLAPNADGHIIRFRDSNNLTGTFFNWDIFIISETTHGTPESFSDPDGIWADPDGRLFIQTDGGQKDGLNNQILVADTRTGEIRRLLEGVAGDEITGLTLTPDRRTLFINTQHPGNGNPNLTNFPVLNEVPDGETIPRDATFVITRKDGGVIGS